VELPSGANDNAAFIGSLGHADLDLNLNLIPDHPAHLPKKNKLTKSKSTPALRLFVASCWLLAACCLLLVARCLLLVRQVKVKWDKCNYYCI